MNADIGMKFRKNILEKGGGQSSIHLVEEFLGRKVSHDAFLNKYDIFK